MNNCTYMILNLAEVDNVNFSEILNTSADTLRRSNDGNLFIVKWDGGMPPTIYNIAPVGDETVKTVYTHEEILNIMQTENWVSEELI